MKNKLELTYDWDEDLVCFRAELLKDPHYPICLGIIKEDDEGMEEIQMSTAEAKALLHFLRENLAPNLENK